MFEVFFGEGSWVHMVVLFCIPRENMLARVPATLKKTCVHFPITLSLGGSKSLGSPSASALTTIYRLSFGFETSKIKLSKKKKVSKK